MPKATWRAPRKNLTVNTQTCARRTNNTQAVTFTFVFSKGTLHHSDTWGNVKTNVIPFRHMRWRQEGGTFRHIKVGVRRQRHYPNTGWYQKGVTPSRPTKAGVRGA